METCGGDRRRAVDFAHQMRWLVDEDQGGHWYDNLNTHKLGSLYEA